MKYHRNAGIEATIKQQTSNLDAWLVYADWLQSHGDPRGEIIPLEVMLQRNQATDPTQVRYQLATLYRQNVQQWVSEIDFNPLQIRFNWKFGFINKVQILPEANEGSIIKLFKSGISDFITSVKFKNNNFNCLNRCIHSKSLNSIQDLDLSENRLDMIPEILSGFPQLKSLNLANNLLRKLPSSIYKMKHLRALNIAGNKIRLDEAEVLENVNQLENLSYLNLALTGLNKIPAILPDLTSLEVLNLNANYIIGSLGALQSLHKLRSIGFTLSNTLGDIEVINELDQLIELRIRKSSDVEDLPRWLGNLKQANKIVSLDLSQGYLTKAPDWLPAYKNINYLNLQLNQLKTLPDYFNEFKNLRVLDIERNEIRKLPKSISSLKSLTTLKAGYNKFTKIEKEILSLPALKTLDLSYTEIKSLPDAIAMLSNLQELVMVHCKFEQLPAGFCKLKALQKIDLRNSRLKVLNDKLHQLYKLEYLNISNNQMTIFPEAITKIPVLKTLDISDNQFSLLPSEENSLTNLQKLNMDIAYYALFPKNHWPSKFTYKYQDLFDVDQTETDHPNFVAHETALAYLEFELPKEINFPTNNGYIKLPLYKK